MFLFSFLVCVLAVAEGGSLSSTRSLCRSVLVVALLHYVEHLLFCVFLLCLCCCHPPASVPVFTAFKQLASNTEGPLPVQQGVVSA